MSRVYRIGDDGKDSDVEAKLKGIGVTIRDLTGNVKPFNEIITETSEKFKNLTQSERLSIAQSLGG